MAETRTLQQVVLGEILPHVGRRSAAMAGEARVSSGRRRGSTSGGAVAVMSWNALRVPQSVVKRVGTGGCHSPKELRRQMKYILRDEAQVAAWSNQIGIDRVFGERGIENVIADWSASWCGAPKRGHTDHIILSFPKGTEAELAEAISREWAQEVFGGDYRDRYRYVAALHCNTDHVHAHVLVDKVGMEDGKFLSISRHSEISYDMMRELHAQIAGEHGLVLNASSRLSRGIMENAPRDTDLQAARKEGREPVVAPLDPESRTLREAEIRRHAEGYRQLAQLAGMGLEADTPPDGWMGRIAEGAELAATNLMKGMPVKEGFAEGVDIPAAGADVIGRLIAARETLQAEADTAWSAIQDMAPGAEKVELEQLFAGQAREMGTLLGRDFLADHSSSVSPERDPYSVQGIAGLRKEVSSNLAAVRSLEGTRSALSIARLGCGGKSSNASSMVTIRSVSVTSVRSARAKVVLPVDVPPLIMMFNRSSMQSFMAARISPASVSAITRSAFACRSASRSINAPCSRPMSPKVSWSSL